MKKSFLVSALFCAAILAGSTSAQAAPCQVSNVLFSFNMPKYLQGGGWAYKLEYDTTGSCTGAQGGSGVFVDRYNPATGTSIQTLAAPAGIGKEVNLGWSFASTQLEYLRIRSGAGTASVMAFGPMVMNFPSNVSNIGAHAVSHSQVTVNWAFSGSAQNHSGFIVRRSVKLANGSWGSYIKVASVPKNHFSYGDTLPAGTPAGARVKYLVQSTQRQDTNQPFNFMPAGGINSYPMVSLEVVVP